MSVSDVLAELQRERMIDKATPATLKSWKHGKVFVADGQFQEVTHVSLDDAGMPLDKQQAFEQKLDDILLGRTDVTKSLSSAALQLTCEK